MAGGLDVPNFDILAPGAGGPSGLFKALDPAYQLQQAAVRRANAFADGVPRDAQGNLDLGAVRDKLIQVGDYGDASNFLTTDLQQQSLAAAMRNSGSVGQYGGGQDGGSAPGTAASPMGGFQPAAGGGMIATGAGGDSFGRLPAAPAQGGQGGGSAPAGDYLSRLAQVESGGNDNAPASGSSAFGRYRFTDGTWKGLAQQYPQLGLTSDGRSDLGQQQRAIQAFTNDNASALGRAGFQPTPGNLYLAHFAGAAGAIGALQADPNAPVSAVLGGAAVKANPFLANMTAGSLVGWANGRMAGVDPSTVPGSPGGMPPDVAASLVRLRAGQGTPQDGAALSAYQASRAQGQGGVAGGPPPQQPAAVPAAGGGAIAPAAGGDDNGQLSAPASSGAPIGDADVMAARKLIQATSGYDPASLAPATRQAVVAAKAKVASYLQKQNAPSTDSAAPTSDVSPMTGMHPYAPGGNAMRSAPAAPPAVPAAPPQGAAPGAPGAPGGPAAAPGGPAGGFTPVSFGGPGGGAPGAPQAPQPPVVARAPALSSPQGTAPTLGNPPPDVAAALARLQGRQGSPADAQLWGSWLKGQTQGGAAGGGQAAPSSPYGAAPGSQGSPLGRPAPIPTQPTTPPPGLLDPSLGGQVPGAWLKAGHSAGEWVNYARAQAALNGALPFGYGKANEDAWNAIAAGAAQTIDKSLQYTNEQRNARDPMAVQYETDKFNREQAARLAADTDPSRVTFAGNEAAARAAGTAAYDLVPTTPTPGGPTVYRTKADIVAGNASGGPPAVQAMPAVFGQKQEALGKLDGEMQSQFQTRQVAQERIDAMSNLLETFQSGAGADAKAAAVAAVRAAGFNIPDSVTANPAAVEQFSKNATANIFASAKDMGGRVLVTELQGLQKSNANPNMQPASNAAILAQQKGLLNYEDAHYQDYSAWRQNNPYATDASSFETAWAKAHPVGAYVAAARKDIAPLGAPLPPQSQLVDGQAYMVQPGQKMRWSASSGQFVPFSGTTAPALPGQGGGQPAGGQGQGSNAPQSAPPVAGARQARDGNWYVADPSRPGKFMMVSR